jgi:hypothetical protein
MSERSAAPKLMRRTYIVDRSFQSKYTLLLVIAGTSISGLFAAMLYLAYSDAQRSLERAFEATGAKMPPEVTLNLAESNTTLIWVMVGICLLMAVAFGLFGILVTHRVAGPAYVMTHYVSILAAGRYPMMRPLRKNDELKQFFERFQQAIEAMRQRESDEADVLDSAMNRLAQSGSSDLAQLAESLKAMRDRKRDATDRVQIGRMPS